MRRDTVVGTLSVAAVLCIVCSVLVSAAAVSLRPLQERNKDRFQKKNILIAAGLLGAKEEISAEEIRDAFQQIETRIIDLNTGEPAQGVDIDEYNPREAAKDPEINVMADGLAGIERREPYKRVYLIKKNGKLDKVVLPIYGKGLWSTLYGFIALEGDLNTVAGLAFYSHAETPGLGGEVDNPAWRALWKGKKVHGPDGEIQIQVIKGRVESATPNAEHKVDGLSGATITSRGVSNLVRYWLSDGGFGKYLSKLKSSAA